jgi:hypothetical protein
MRQINRIGRTSRRTNAAAVVAALGLVLTAVPLTAQSTLLSGINPFGPSRSGFHLYDVTGFASWESFPSGQNGFVLPLAGTLRADEIFGGGVSVGWSHPGQRSNLSFTYTANYIGRVRYSDWSGLNQSLSLSASRHLSPNWTLGLSGASSISTYDQLLFSPTLFGSLAAAPATFDELSSAVLGGKFTNDQLASLLTGAPTIESPASTLLFGNRMFSSYGTGSLSYAYSRRLTIGVSLGVSQTQHLNDKQNPNAPQYVYLSPRAVMGSANVNVSYSMSPRTQMGFSLSTSRGFSQIQQAYTSSASAYIGRTIGRSWFAQVHGGAGFVTNIRSQYPVHYGTSPVAGASLGYKLRSQTFMAAYDRMISQAYGVGAADTTTINAAWQWRRPGRRWGLSSSYMREQFRNGIFNNIDGWRATGGVSRFLGWHAVLEAAYSYGSYKSETPLRPYQSAQNAVRLSVMWVPQSMEGH